MKIAIFSDSFPPKTDGVANVAYQSARNLTNLGHKVMVFTVLDKDSERQNNYSYEFDVIALPSLSSSLVYPESRFTIPVGISLKHLRRFKPNVIHTHTPFSVGWEAVLAAKILHIPLVGTHHTFFDHYLKYAKLDHKWGKKFSWKCTVGYYNRCDLILSPSHSLANALIAQGIKKPTAVLQNSIDIDLFKPATREERKDIKKHFNISEQSLVYMGRLGYEKSIDQVIRSFALALKKMPELKLMIIGDGPDKKRLKELANDLGIKKNIIFTGYLFKEELVKALQANDIFITASKSENMPLSVLEAMATGLPIIAVRENGLAEIIKDGLNGFFAKTDDPDDLAKKTLNLLSSPDLIEKLGKESRNLSLEYSPKKVTRLLEDLYNKVLK